LLIKLFKRIACATHAPRKLTLPQYIMTLAEYRDIIEEHSDETGKEDRLACRNRAAAKLLAEMDDKKREELEKARDELHEESVGAWTNFQMMKDGEYDVSEETQAKYIPIPHVYLHF
jgi:DNA-binding transcriptional MerR regulator